MERDLDLKPGLKIVGCLTVAVLTVVFVWGLFGDALIQRCSLYNNQRLKNQDFEFFGRIIAESGEPIEGVSFVAEWETYRDNLFSWIFMGRMAKNSLEIESDSDGRFAITGVRGVNLQIFDFAHPSYEIAGERKFWGFSTSYSSSRTEGLNINDPFIIKMAAKSSENRP